MQHQHLQYPKTKNLNIRLIFPYLLDLTEVRSDVTRMVICPE